MLSNVWEGVRSEAFAANTESVKLATAAKMTRKAQAPELETVNFPSRHCLGSSLFSFCTCPCNVRMLHMCGRVVMASKLFLNDKNSSRKLFALSCSVVIIWPVMTTYLGHIGKGNKLDNQIRVQCPIERRRGGLQAGGVPQHVHNFPGKCKAQTCQFVISQWSCSSSATIT